MITYQTIILASWITFILVWGVLSVGVKKDIRGGFGGALSRMWLIRVAAVAIVLFVIVRITTGTAHYARSMNAAFFADTLFASPISLDWAGAVFAAVGIACAIWARLYLGRNWSARPAVKENHELVMAGPYAYVRHPIYTGIILATFGIALTGAVIGIVMCIFSLIILSMRIPKEENIMLELFPDAYPGYQARTKKLVPFVW